jgi:hypothetical protein
MVAQAEGRSQRVESSGWNSEAAPDGDSDDTAEAHNSNDEAQKL